jgi:serine/threonine protein kinase
MARIQEYGIRALLGEGALGTVYAAEDRRGRKAALKIMHDACVEDRERVERFRQQAGTIEQMGHAHLVEVVEAGVLPGGQPYLLSERLCGETLGDRLRRIPCLPVPDALDFAAQAAAALGSLHERGLVHGGLTREDLFLVPDLSMARGERVKLADAALGPLRRRIDPARALPVGAALYLAPEVWSGGQADRRADVYALGGVLYNALCGAPPYLAPTAGELMWLHRSDEPVSMRKLNPDVPRHIEAAVRRAMARRPEDRFASMAAFARALRPAARPASVLRPVAAGLAAAICGLFLFSASAPGEMAAPSPAKARVVAVAARPNIVQLPERPVTRIRLRKVVRQPRPIMTAFLEREDLWGRRH